VVILNYAATMCSLSIVYPHIAVNNVEATMLYGDFISPATMKLTLLFMQKFDIFVQFCPNLDFQD
jgi:hypothetical protein